MQVKSLLLIGLIALAVQPAEVDLLGATSHTAPPTTPASTSVLVPDVIGMPQVTALITISSVGLAVGTITAQTSTTFASGDVISQSPVAGTSVSAGSAVNLIVSTGSTPVSVSVPNVVGMTQAAASTAITGAGLVVGSVTSQSSSTVASGDVISESPAAATSVSPGSAVNLVISTTPAPPPTSTGPIISQVADGGGWKTEIYLINSAITGGTPAQFSINFYGDGGAAQLFSWQEFGSQSTLTGTLGPSQSTVFKTTGTAATSTEGWAQIVTNSTTLSGFAVFTNTVNGNEAAVPFDTPATGDLILPYDNTNGYGMGVAILSLTGQTILATILNQSGATLGTEEVTLNAQGHTAFDLTTNWPVTAGQMGIVVFNGAGALLGVRYNPQGAFTSVAEIPAQ